VCLCGVVTRTYADGVKSWKRAGSGSLRAWRMVRWPGVISLRCDTRPSTVAMVTRCMRSSSFLMLRQVSPQLTSATRMTSRASPAQLHVGGDAIFEAVEHWTELDHGLEVPPAPFDLVERFVAERDVLGREGLVGGAQEELAVEPGLFGHRRSVDAQQPGLGAPQETVERRPGAQCPGELGALGGRQRIGARDLPFEAGDDLGSHHLVALGALGVVTDNEAVTHRLAVDTHLLHPQVARHRPVATLT
jgi:hypothetical protein